MASTFKSYVTSGIGLANTTILTASTTITVIGLSIANKISSSVTASVILSKNGDGSAFVVKNAPVPYGGSMIVVGAEQKVVLQVGDTIKVSANTESSVDVIVSTLEFS